MPSFHDPSRPALQKDVPAYPFDKPLAALPSILIKPEKNGWRLSLWLVVNKERTAREFSKYVIHICVSSGDSNSIEEILYLYDSDPEACMKEVFLWPGIKEETMDEKILKTIKNDKSLRRDDSIEARKDILSHFQSLGIGDEDEDPGF